MSYRLQTNEALPAGIKRIATEQIERALIQLTEAPDGESEAWPLGKRIYVEKPKAFVKRMGQYWQVCHIENG